MKKYVVPIMEIVELMAEEQMAKCYHMNKDANQNPVKEPFCTHGNSNTYVGA